MLLKKLEASTICAFVFAFCISLIAYFTVELEWATITPQARISRERLQYYSHKYNESAIWGSNPFDPEITEQRLSKWYPYNEINRTAIPRNIFQMWRDYEFPYREQYSSWQNMNPTFNFTFQTNDEIIDLVTEEFKDTVPEIIEALELLPSVILKSDFSRYILLFMYGGSYSDLDVNLELPMDEWFDTNRDIGFVCGLEEDINARNWRSRSPRRHQIQNWFFKSKARHPILRRLIATVVKTTFEAVQNGKGPSYNTKGFEYGNSQNILSWTGPILFTDVIFAYLNSLVNPTIVDTNVHRFTDDQNLWGPNIPDGVGIHWKTVTGLDGPILLNDVLMYPFYTTRGPPGKDRKKNYYITHMFSGSWKKKFIFF